MYETQIHVRTLRTAVVTGETETKPFQYTLTLPVCFSVHYPYVLFIVYFLSTLDIRWAGAGVLAAPECSQFYQKRSRFAARCPLYRLPGGLSILVRTSDKKQKLKTKCGEICCPIMRTENSAAVGLLIWFSRWGYSVRNCKYHFVIKTN